MHYQTTQHHNSRDRIVVSTLRCGRSNPGSNPGHGSEHKFADSAVVKTFFIGKNELTKE